MKSMHRHLERLEDITAAALDYMLVLFIPALVLGPIIFGCVYAAVTAE